MPPPTAMEKPAVRPTHPDGPLAKAPDQSEQVLVIIDMLSDWQAPGMDVLLKAAHARLPRLVQLKQACRDAGIPTIYANDNLGRWRSDCKSLVASAVEAGGMARDIAEQLGPDAQDYFVLKPKHSAFFATPMDLLLEHLGAEHLLLTGVSADQCVLATATDALMHDYEVTVLGDCIAAPTAQRTQAAIAHFEQVMRTRVAVSTDPNLTQPTT